MKTWPIYTNYIFKKWKKMAKQKLSKRPEINYLQVKEPS